MQGTSRDGGTCKMIENVGRGEDEKMIENIGGREKMLRGKE